MAINRGTVFSSPLDITRREIEDERAARIAEHKEAIALRATHKSPRFQLATDFQHQPLNILAEGDSWFDYPLSNDVIDCIRKGAATKPDLLSLAHYGDITTNMLGAENRARIKELLNDKEHGTFDAMLFSGGGNDLVGNQFCLWVKDFAADASPGDAVQRERLDNILGVVKSAYLDLFELRDRYAPNCVSFIHGYDFALPTGKGVCNVGPWLKPSLDYRKWTDFAKASAVVKEILLAFNNMLIELEKSHAKVVYVRTQGTLSAGNDWANELHPSARGFTKIGGVFLGTLRQVFPGRI